MKKERTLVRQLELPVLADLNASLPRIREVGGTTTDEHAPLCSYRASAQDQSIYDAISADYFRSIADVSTR